MKYIALLLYFLILNYSELTIAAADEDVPYQSRMYTRLVFTSGSRERIEFHSHELVYIARKVLEETGDYVTPRIDPSYSSYKEKVEKEYTQFRETLTRQAATYYGVSQDGLSNLLDTFYRVDPTTILINPRRFSTYLNIMDKIKRKKDKMKPLIVKDYDDHILPIRIVPEYSALGWLGFARHVKANERITPISGWWIPIGKRLILLRNMPTPQYHFYVSDHGFRKDVVLDTKQNLLKFSERDASRQMLYSFEFHRFYEGLIKDEREYLKYDFMLMFHRKEVKDPFQREFLLYVLSLPKDFREGALEKRISDAPCFRSIGTRDTKKDPFVFPIEDDEQKVFAKLLRVYEDIFENTLERIRHRGGIQTPAFIEGVFGRGLSSFFKQIDEIFHEDDAERFKVFFILKELAIKLGEGLQEYLFRPLYSFGSREEGESYRGFSEAVKAYYETELSLLPYELAQEMRRLLKGERLSDEKLYFLPNLVAAWFVSETARNEISLLSGLMLLDLIESGVSHIDGDGNNLYDWHHTLVHPRKPADSRVEVLIPDLYGDEIDLANFDGIHPMAHGGSVREGRRILGKGQKLSAVQQKEGHLIIHWLLERMKREEEELGFKIEVSEEPLIYEHDVHPDYKEIEGLWNASKIEKPSNKIKNSTYLTSKYNLLQTIIGHFNKRVGSLDNLLPVRDPEIIEADVKAEKKPFFIDPRAAVSEGLMELFYATAAEEDEDREGASASEDTLEEIKEASRKDAEKKGDVGPKDIPGWKIKDVEGLGNCFYDAVGDQLSLSQHSSLLDIPERTLIRDSLRLRIQGDRFRDEEWANDETIDEFVKIFSDCILAVVDTRRPERGFTCYFVDEAGEVRTLVPDMEAALPEGRHILRIATTGNHFMSIKSHPALEKGVIRDNWNLEDVDIEASV